MQARSVCVYVCVHGIACKLHMCMHGSKRRVCMHEKCMPSCKQLHACVHVPATSVRVSATSVHASNQLVIMQISNNCACMQAIVRCTHMRATRVHACETFGVNTCKAVCVHACEHLECMRVSIWSACMQATFVHACKQHVCM